MRAVKVSAANRLTVDSSAPIPTLQPEYLLVRVSHVSLNPTDWKAASRFNPGDIPPHTVGCDASGQVVEIGDQVPPGRFRIGDRVAGLCYGIRLGHPASGAFGEYCLFKAGLTIHVPDRISDAEAATLGVGINIVGQALYQTLRLPWPSVHNSNSTLSPTVLIYGGSTATGLFAIQYARLSCCHVLTTCSPRNAAKCKTLGAHETFDYGDPVVCATAIRKATGNELLYAFDCISEGSSRQICADALTSRSDAAHYVGVLPVAGPFPRNDVIHGWRSGYTAFGEAYNFAGKMQEARPDDYAFAREFWAASNELVTLLNLEALVQKRDGGLDGIIRGLEELRGGHVRGGKLVYRVQ